LINTFGVRGSCGKRRDEILNTGILICVQLLPLLVKLTLISWQMKETKHKDHEDHVEHI